MESQDYKEHSNYRRNPEIRAHASKEEDDVDCQCVGVEFTFAGCAKEGPSTTV